MADEHMKSAQEQVCRALSLLKNASAELGKAKDDEQFDLAANKDVNGSHLPWPNFGAAVSDKQQMKMAVDQAMRALGQALASCPDVSFVFTGSEG